MIKPRKSAACNAPALALRRCAWRGEMATSNSVEHRRHERRAAHQYGIMASGAGAAVWRRQASAIWHQAGDMTAAAWRKHRRKSRGLSPLAASGIRKLAVTCSMAAQKRRGAAKSRYNGGSISGANQAANTKAGEISINEIMAAIKRRRHGVSEMKNRKRLNSSGGRQYLAIDVIITRLKAAKISKISGGASMSGGIQI